MTTDRSTRYGITMGTDPKSVPMMTGGKDGKPLRLPVTVTVTVTTARPVPPQGCVWPNG